MLFTFASSFVGNILGAIRRGRCRSETDAGDFAGGRVELTPSNITHGGEGECWQTARHSNCDVRFVLDVASGDLA